MKSIKGNGQEEKPREPGITQQQPHREEDDKEHAEVQEDRQDGDNSKDKEILQHILDAPCNHKIRMNKR